ncbi:apoptosis-stimulating of p53 protein 1 isoform 2-T2 [Mantella aurantiaca]
MMPTILTVFLSNNEQILTEVPITPETTCRDVVEFCKEPGEGACHLAEVWRGNERPLPFDHLMFDHLQKWGPRREEVKFFLRHEEFPAEGNDQTARQAPNQRNGVTGEKRAENGVGNPRVELTLSELQDMASRQQQQIENQQQMLVAKEQRLRYLKQQERRQLQNVSETEKLQKLKERVETQENKLKKIRAMRGQVDYSKVMNGNLSVEIEHISDVFQEKQQELQAAVQKVEQLSQQLEDLRKGKLNGFQTYNGQMTGPAALELKKLYQELQIRNRLNQEQNTKLQQQKELLNKRNMEVAIMDKRINELRERLYKKKVEARQKENIPLNRINGAPSPQSTLASGRVAAVGPYIQIPSTVNYTLPADPVKPQSLSLAATGTHTRSKSASDATWPALKQNAISVVKTPPLGTSDWKESNVEAGFKTAPISSQPLPSAAVGPTEKLSTDGGKLPSPIPGLSKTLPHNYGMYQGPLPLSATNSLERRKDGSLTRPGSGPTARTRPLPLPTPSNAHPPGSSQLIQQRISVPPSPTYPPSSSPMFPGTDTRPDPPLTVAIRPFLAEKGSRPQSPRKGPQTVNSSSIYSMYLQQSTPPKNYQQAVYNTLNKSVKAVYGKPVVQSGSSNSSPLPFLHNAPAPGGDKEGEVEGSAPAVEGSGVENIPRPLSPTKLTPIVHSPLRYQSDADLEALRRKLANAPRPLKKRSSITEPEGPSGPNIQKLLYQRFNTLAGGMEAAPFYQQCNSQEFVGVSADVDNGNASNNGNVEEASSLQPPILPPAIPVPQPPAPEPQVSSDNNDNKVCSPITEEVVGNEIMNQISDTTEDDNNNPAIVPSNEKTPSPILEEASPVKEEVPVPVPAPAPATVPPQNPSVKRTNLKKPNSERTGHGLRVRFNPLALLLDASLEGEFDLVQRIIYEVEDPSKPNDEGITPLHNAVCAGHHHIVKFLLDFGVNVNAADSDGWTPLHCAASCNSVHLCKMLVECGAAIFATTISDTETAADKCEEMEEGYIQCSQFLYGVQEKLGVMNKGLVYALWDFEAQNADELSFREGDTLTILRRKDDAETDWWWARLNEKEGYVPKNLLGLYPRIKPRQRTLA